VGFVTTKDLFVRPRAKPWSYLPASLSTPYLDNIRALRMYEKLMEVDIRVRQSLDSHQSL
jgi:hypothetical protein